MTDKATLLFDTQKLLEPTDRLKHRVISKNQSLRRTCCMCVEPGRADLVKPDS